VKWLADENFDNDILRGLLRRTPRFDILRVQDIGLTGASDVDVLAWSTANGRIVLTHDVSTMVPALKAQLESRSHCAPIILVPDDLPIAQAIENILLLDECSTAADWVSGVLYLPLR